MAKKKPTPDGSSPTPPQATELQRAMFEAHHSLHEAHINYTQALAIARDTELSDGEMLALRNKGRIYAEAVTRYTNAVMAWLALVEVDKVGAVKALRKEAGMKHPAISVGPRQLESLPEKS